MLVADRCASQQLDVGRGHFLVGVSVDCWRVKQVALLHFDTQSYLRITLL